MGFKSISVFIYPFSGTGGCSGLFLLVFLCAEGVGEGEEEKDRDLDNGK